MRETFSISMSSKTTHQDNSPFHCDSLRTSECLFPAGALQDMEPEKSNQSTVTNVTIIRPSRTSIKDPFVFWMAFIYPSLCAELRYLPYQALNQTLMKRMNVVQGFLWWCNRMREKNYGINRVSKIMKMNYTWICCVVYNISHVKFHTTTLQWPQEIWHSGFGELSCKAMVLPGVDLIIEGLLTTKEASQMKNKKGMWLNITIIYSVLGPPKKLKLATVYDDLFRSHAITLPHPFLLALHNCYGHKGEEGIVYQVACCRINSSPTLPHW